MEIRTSRAARRFIEERYEGCVYVWPSSDDVAAWIEGSQALEAGGVPPPRGEFWRHEVDGIAVLVSGNASPPDGSFLLTIGYRRRPQQHVIARWIHDRGEATSWPTSSVRSSGLVASAWARSACVRLTALARSEPMRDRIEALLRDVTLITLALAIAAGWALFQVGSGVANTITVLLNHFPPGDLYSRPSFYGVLTWRVGDRILTVGDFVKGLIELTVVVAVALFVQTRRTAAR